MTKQDHLVEAVGRVCADELIASAADLEQALKSLKSVEAVADTAGVDEQAARDRLEAVTYKLATTTLFAIGPLMGRQPGNGTG